MQRVFFLYVTWKYSFGCLVVFGDFVLGFFGGGVSGEGGGVAGLCIVGEGVICAVFGGLCTVMVAVSICSVCCAGGVVSFSGVVGCRLAGGVGLVTGRLAGAGWRGHSPAGGVGRLLLSAPFLSNRWLVDFRKVTSILT